MAVTKKRKTADDKHVAQKDNVCKSMHESQEAHMSGHLEEIVAAVSVTPRRKPQSRLPQTALFQPPREKLHLCEEKATRYASSHEYKQAIHELTRCVALTRICYGDSHWKLAEAHINLAQGYLQLKGLSLQAKQHAEKARDILVHAIVPPYNDDTDVFRCSVELFHTLGRASLSLQQFKEAAENLAKAERLSKELLQCGRIIREEWLEVQARIQLSFGQVCQGQKKSKEALPHYQEALECVQTSKGDKSRECVPVLRELAGAEQALGSHDAAIDHLSQAHQIVSSRNPSQEEAADSALSVARAAAASGRPEDRDVAEQYFQESLAHLRDCGGTGRAQFLSIQDEFCHFLQITGQKERATAVLRESLEAKVGAFGDFSPEVAETYRLLGGADLAQGNHSGAHRKLKKDENWRALLAPDGNFHSESSHTFVTEKPALIPGLGGGIITTVFIQVKGCGRIPEDHFLAVLEDGDGSLFQDSGQGLEQRQEGVKGCRSGCRAGTRPPGVSPDSDPSIRTTGQEDPGHPADPGRPGQGPGGCREAEAGSKSQMSLKAKCCRQGQAQRRGRKPLTPKQASGMPRHGHLGFVPISLQLEDEPPAIP